jgi:hypothetical protein
VGPTLLKPATIEVIMTNQLPRECVCSLLLSENFKAGTRARGSAKPGAFCVRASGRQTRALLGADVLAGPTIQDKRPRGHYTAWPLRDSPLALQRFRLGTHSLRLGVPV